MFRGYKNNEQHMKNLYKKVNQYYKTIDREMIKQIVRRIDEISDMYFNICFPDMNSKQKSKNENNLMTKRILHSKIINEASTFDTVLNFICAVFHFMGAYKHEPHKVFHFCNIYDWMICANRKVDLSKRDLSKRHMFMYNDNNISDKVEKFLSISDDEIVRLINLYRKRYEN